MVEDQQDYQVFDEKSPEDWLNRAQDLVPIALRKAKEVGRFPGRWKAILSRLEEIPSQLSDLSSHPCFSRNSLCKEQLQVVCQTLGEAVNLAEFCSKEGCCLGKLRMQSDLDSLIGKLDLNLQDCGLLIKTGVLGDATTPNSKPESKASVHGNIRELLARLQIGHLQAKHKALDKLIEILREDENKVAAALNRGSISALVQLLSPTSPHVREKTAALICSLAESQSYDDWLVGEGILPPLIRLLESGSEVGKEKAVISLQSLSISVETSREIVGHGSIRPLVEICQKGNSVLQAAAAGTLKNLSAVPDVRQTLAEEGVVKVMINILADGLLLGSKMYAAECLQYLTLSNETLRKMVVSENGIQSLLAYLDGPLPQEPAVAALRNMVGSVPVGTLISLGFLPRVAHVLKSGSTGAQQLAASAICQICTSSEVKKLVGEAGCIPLLIRLLDSKSRGGREIAAQAISSLMMVSQNCREVKRDEKSVPSLVQLLEPTHQNMAKKYAVVCLGHLSSSKKCKKSMISHGAIGYLRKLAEMDVLGAKKLLERLERGKLRSLLARK